MFESSIELTPKQVKWLDKCTRGTWQLNPSTGLVDVDGSFDCSNQGLSDFKGIRFGKVKVYFFCSNNQLTTLEGAPQEVGEHFWCDNNELTTLEGAPQLVGESFICSYNSLISLEGAPREVGGDFYCDNNQLTSLEGAPREVKGDFWGHNNGLTSLEGAPQKVGGSFYCSDNGLTSLVGAPREVREEFSCEANPVSEKTLKSIFGIMETGKGYLEATEYLWPEIPLEDQALLYRPEFEWVVGDERRKFDALRAYQGFKGMI